MPDPPSGGTILAGGNMKKILSANGRKHGLRARVQVTDERSSRTVLTFESRSQAYTWTTDRGRSRHVVKH